MNDQNENIELLVSLPPASARTVERRSELSDVFVTSDPEGAQLGSGGGTAYILHQALRASGVDNWSDWLQQDRKLLIHGSGESRRLPAYAAPGKPLTPMPIIEGLSGQRPGQTLLDFQRRSYERFFLHAPESYRLMIACGDVLVENDTWLPTYPSVDCLIVGLRASHKEARQHGVLVCGRDTGNLLSFLQKPDTAQLEALDDTSSFYLDSGVWLLTEKAVMSLLGQCGWDEQSGQFRGEHPDNYDLYGEFGLALGTTPSAPNAAVSALSAASLPLRHGRFYHFGTNRSLLGSVQQLNRAAREPTSFGDSAMQADAPPVQLNATVEADLSANNRYIWIENAHIPATWTLRQRHVLTGIPKNDWQLDVPIGVCLDIAPVGKRDYCIRPYGFDDTFRGPLASETTLWMGQPLSSWMSKRGLQIEQILPTPTDDIQDAPLFPVLSNVADAGPLVQWLIAENPDDDATSRDAWLAAARVSNRMLLTEANLERMSADRLAHRTQRDPLSQSFIEKHWAWLDLKATADNVLDTEVSGLLAVDDDEEPQLDLGYVHTQMFRNHLATQHKQDLGPNHADAAASLRSLLIEEAILQSVEPQRNVLDDQIVWARSPIRIDIAGGWSDTPPFCLERGGRVVNLAVDLNGQPPIQVFAKICATPHIVIRSIDLGLDETIHDFETLSEFGELGGGFGIARAALSLAGFDPRFYRGTPFATLSEMLQERMGGGIELSLLAAVPKGSGLGTSSILAATVLGALGELCGLGWDKNDIFTRTLVLEQLLTSGGGWQDQIGGVTSGLKLIETEPGLRQNATVRGLPDAFFANQYVNRSVLLYYTGITRVAHDILGEIVSGIFLNSARHITLIQEIAYNADFAADALQRHDWDGFCESIRRSWALNQMLDSGTNPPAVQEIIDKVSPHLAACKLLGAGGGGYLLMIANDSEDGARIKEVLDETPPNDRARFVDLNLSETGFQVTKS